MSRERFKGKTILVTGAAQGIGEAVARHLVAEGALVFALDVHQQGLEALAAELNVERRSIEPVVADISDRKRISEAIAAIEARHELAGLVNGAGVLFPEPFPDISPESWEKTFDVNTYGTFFVAREVAARMIRRRGGSIVTIASNASHVPRVNMSAYCASKAASAMLTKCMGLELARYGIRCNVVSPGSTNTRMLGALADDGVTGRQAVIDGSLSLFRTGIPLGRLAEPSDIALAVAFLLSDEARHITMHDLFVDGGASLH